MMRRYMLYQIAYALFKFLQQKEVPEEDRNQAECEYNLACYHIGNLIRYTGRHHARQK